MRPYLILFASGQVHDDAVHLGKGLVELGLVAGDNVGILSPNRAEWTTSMLGFSTQSMVTVALYDTLGILSRLVLAT